jgi:hypothetical protein
MKKWVAWVVIAIVLVVLAWLLTAHTEQPGESCPADQPWPCGLQATGTKDIWVTNPHPKDGPVSSPVTVHGFIRTSWVFEASFPVVIVDWDGRIIGQGPARTDSDWMQDKMVQFEAAIPFTPPACASGQDYCKRGAIIFKNDNPSGDPARDKAFELPVTFK